ncbi:MAG: RNA methyltransferase [Bacteroidota bacterium]
MVGKKWLKLVRSLHLKKYRTQHQLFFVEGEKTIDALLAASYKPVQILAEQEILPKYQAGEALCISERDLATISALKNPSGVLGIFEMPTTNTTPTDGWTLALDDVRDPGNLGTIIRLCDWFGISHLVCSPTTVDCYNPKVLQATMGSIARVQLSYQSLPTFLANTSRTVYGGFMEGTPMPEVPFSATGILVMGNEANGISPAVEAHIDHKVAIPKYGDPAAESLNVAIASGIVLNTIRQYTTP